MRIRDVEPDLDAAACAAIYEPSVSSGVASLEERAPQAEEMSRRIAAITADYPWLVAEVDGVISGYAYAGRHHERAAYRWSANVTVYISARHHRRGIGRALYDTLLERLVTQGVYVACAGITLPNEPSVALHESLGFEPVGVYRNIAYKFGAWRDVGWWQKRLRPLPEGGRAPAELAPPGGR